MLVDPDDVESTDIVEAALSRIRERILERRASGDYPPGLEDELDRHYRQVSDSLHGTSPSLRSAAAAAQLVGSRRFAAERISYQSRIPGGGAIHRAVGKATIRQTHGLLQQMQEFSVVTQEALEASLAALRESVVHTHPQLEQRLAYLADKLAALESHRGDVALFEDRLARLEANFSIPAD